MKRTQLKPGTKPMARSGPIKPRAKRHRDTTESLAVRDRYREENPECEIEAFIRAVRKSLSPTQRAELAEFYTPMSVRIAIDFRPLQVHHLWAGQRLDLWSMLITLEAAWHDHCHARPTEGLLLCLCAKAAKSPPEINDAEFCQCSGRASLAGWLTMDDTVAACPSWLEPMRLELVKRLEAT